MKAPPLLVGKRLVASRSEIAASPALGVIWVMAQDRRSRVTVVTTLARLVADPRTNDVVRVVLTSVGRP
ncbi:hypothetical protein GCM10009844_41350 [Nocardioides koreensis]|uniref:Uncharacterized protein n=1 Tax=Nocardioides koreensis TaxID=433651 RepID=A0ABN3A764_9ACTN